MTIFCLSLFSCLSLSPSASLPLFTHFQQYSASAAVILALLCSRWVIYANKLMFSMHFVIYFTCGQCATKQPALFAVFSRSWVCVVWCAGTKLRAHTDTRLEPCLKPEQFTQMVWYFLFVIWVRACYMHLIHKCFCWFHRYFIITCHSVLEYTCDLTQLSYLTPRCIRSQFFHYPSVSRSKIAVFSLAFVGFYVFLPLSWLC